MKDPTLKTQNKGDELEEALGLRSPGGNFFQEKKKKKRDGGGGVCKSYNKHQTSPFYTSFLGWGPAEEPCLWGNGETQITMNPALSLQALWTSLSLENGCIHLL